MSSPPTTIRILHLNWGLAFVDPAVAEQADAYGWTDKVRQKIFVSASLRPRMTAEVVLHEVLHAIFASCGIPDEITEEQACSMLSGPLLLVMLENPELQAWIQFLLFNAPDI